MELVTNFSQSIFNVSSNSALILNDIDEMTELLRESEKLAEKAKHKFHIDQLDYDTKSFSVISTIIGGYIISLGSVIACIFFIRKLGIFKMAMRTVGVWPEKPRENSKC